MTYIMGMALSIFFVMGDINASTPRVVSSRLTTIIAGYAFVAAASTRYLAHKSSPALSKHFSSIGLAVTIPLPRLRA
jgi:hypothetical protein